MSTPSTMLLPRALSPLHAAKLAFVGLDITLQRVQAHRVPHDHIIVTVCQLFHIPDVEEFTVSPQRSDA